MLDIKAGAAKCRSNSCCAGRQPSGIRISNVLWPCKPWDSAVPYSASRCMAVRKAFMSVQGTTSSGISQQSGGGDAALQHGSRLSALHIGPVRATLLPSLNSLQLSCAILARSMHLSSLLLLQFQSLEVIAAKSAWPKRRRGPTSQESLEKERDRNR